MYDERFKILASRFITKHWWESWAVRMVQQAVQRHWCVHSGAWNRCVLWITGRKRAGNGKEEKGGMGKRWRGGSCTQHCWLPGQGQTSNERATQWSEPNATALSIYRGVTYRNTTDEEGSSNTAPFPNPENKINHRRCSTTKGDVIVCCLSEHMFIVKELWSKFIISLLGGNVYRCSVLDVNRSH